MNCRHNQIKESREWELTESECSWLKQQVGCQFTGTSWSSQLILNSNLCWPATYDVSWQWGLNESEDITAIGNSQTGQQWASYNLKAWHTLWEYGNDSRNTTESLPKSLDLNQSRFTAITHHRPCAKYHHVCFQCDIGLVSWLISVTITELHNFS